MMNAKSTTKTRLISVAIACVLANSTVLADDTAQSTSGESTAVSTDENADNSSENPTIALVNGKPISKLSLERVTDQLSAQGQTPNQDQIIQELINLEILTQEAERLELDKTTDVATALQLQYTQTMANAYLGKFSQDLKISEEEIRAKYEEQIAAIKASEFRARLMHKR